MSKISKRLRVVASLVTEDRIADVGCDHGKLADYLLSNAIAQHVIVSDISMPSLQKAIDLLKPKRYNFDYICCDGLLGYKGQQVNQCIITGMGGEEIVKIISESPIQIDSFILSPQHNNIMTKKFMLNRGYLIDFDIIIQDKNKFYNIFRCRKSQEEQSLSEYDLYFGKANFESPLSDSDAFVNKEISKVKEILSKQFIDNNELKKHLRILQEYKERKEKL